MERWPLVKALTQFGTFSRLDAVQSRVCTLSVLQNTRSCLPTGSQYGYIIGYPTFDLAHARYTSRYVALEAADLVDVNLNVNHSLTPVEKDLFNRYARNTDGMFGQTSNFGDVIWNTALQPVAMESPHTFPFISIGGYLRASFGAAIYADLETNTGWVLSSGDIQRTLQTGRVVSIPGHGTSSLSLYSDVNAEANVITALICHATGRQPASVCNRPVIKQILKHTL